MKIKSLRKVTLSAAVFMGALLTINAQDTLKTESVASVQKLSPAPLTIEQALDIAEDNNPTMRQRKLSLERTQLLLIAQKAALKSNFSLTLNPINYSKRRQYQTFYDNAANEYIGQWYTNESFSTGGTFVIQQPILLTDGTISLNNAFTYQDSYAGGGNSTGSSNKAFSNELYLQLSQPLFTYNRTKQTLKQLEINNENAGISYALQRLQLEQNITSQFYNVYSAQEDLKISEEELKTAEQNYEIVKDKVEADMFRKEELYQAELSLANSRSSVERNTVSLENAKDALKQTLGMPLSEDISVKAEIKAAEVAIDMDHAIQNGLASRLELRQRELDLESAEMTMIETMDQNKFKGNLSLSVGIMGDHERFSNMYDNPTQSPRVQVSFSVPLFDWGERRARINAQKAQQTISKLQQQDEKISIELNIRQTWRSLENLRTQIGIAEKSIENAQQTYDLNLIRYREGELTGLQISQYQSQLSSAKSSYASTLISYKLAVLSLKILSLYDYEQNKPVVPVKGF
jgi:outer membrane protein TolC